MKRAIGTRESAAKFDGLLEMEACQFTCRVLRTPKDFMKHNRTWVSYISNSGISCLIFRLCSAAGAFILNVIYGYNIEPHGEDPLVRLADLALTQFSEAIAPGAWLVDLIPACELTMFWAFGLNGPNLAYHWLIFSEIYTRVDARSWISTHRPILLSNS
jgi:hypothetical protein